MKFKCLFLIIPLWMSFLLPSTAQEPIIFEHTAPVNALAFSPADVSFIASSSADADTIITLRNLRNGTVEHLEATPILSIIWLFRPMDSCWQVRAVTVGKRTYGISHACKGLRSLGMLDMSRFLPMGDFLPSDLLTFLM